MFNFHTPSKRQTTFGFKGAKKQNIAFKWVKEQWLLQDSERRIALEREFQLIEAGEKIYDFSKHLRWKALHQ